VIPYAVDMRSVSDASTNGSTDRLATVVEAAEILGITPDAVRSRLRRGTLERSSERGEDGEVLVVMPAPRNTDQSETVSDQSTDQSGDQSSTDRDASPTVALVERMGSEIDHLREQLDKEREANRENRRLLAAALERIPAIEAGDERESPVTATEDTGEGGQVPSESQETSQRRSWLYKFFFGP
jgi:septal ring factor EnvC (AmiA/AmiB activator)